MDNISYDKSGNQYGYHGDVVLNHTGYGLKENDPSIGKGIQNFPTDEDRGRFEGMLRDGKDRCHQRRACWFTRFEDRRTNS